MSRKILGLDIREHGLFAVLLHSGLKGSTIEAVAQIPLPGKGGDGGGEPSADVSQALSQAMVQLGREMDLNGAISVAAIPSGEAVYRNIRLPFKDEKKIRQILPFELEPTLPHPIDELIFDFQRVRLPSVDNGTEIIAAAARQSVVKGYLDPMNGGKVSPDILTVTGYATALCMARMSDVPENWLFMDVDRNTCAIFILISGQICLVRSFPIGLIAKNKAESLCTHIQRTLAAFEETVHPDCQPEEIHVTGHGLQEFGFEQEAQRILDLPVKRADLVKDATLLRKVKPGPTVAVENAPSLDHALSLALVGAEGLMPLNFRKGPYAARRQWVEHRGRIIRTGILAGLTLLALLANFAIDLLALEKQAAELDRRIETTFRSTFPEVTRIVDPLHQMRIAMEEVQTEGFMPRERNESRVIDILNDISRRIPEAADVEFTRMVIGDDSVLITGNTDTFNAVDEIQTQMEGSEIFRSVTISSTNRERTSNRVQFKIRVAL